MTKANNYDDSATSGDAIAAQAPANAGVLPVKLSSEIEAEQETAYLLRSHGVNGRLFEALARKQDFSLPKIGARTGL